MGKETKKVKAFEEFRKDISLYEYPDDNPAFIVDVIKDYSEEALNELYNDYDFTALFLSLNKSRGEEFDICLDKVVRSFKSKLGIANPYYNWIKYLTTRTAIVSNGIPEEVNVQNKLEYLMTDLFIYYYKLEKFIIKLATAYTEFILAYNKGIADKSPNASAETLFAEKEYFLINTGDLLTDIKNTASKIWNDLIKKDNNIRVTLVCYNQIESIINSIEVSQFSSDLFFAKRMVCLNKIIDEVLKEFTSENLEDKNMEVNDRPISTDEVIQNTIDNIRKYIHELESIGFKQDDSLLQDTKTLYIDIERCEIVMKTCLCCKEELRKLLEKKDHLKEIQSIIVNIPYINSTVSTNLMFAEAGLNAVESFKNTILKSFIESSDDEIEDETVQEPDEKPKKKEYTDLLNISLWYNNVSGIVSDIIKCKDDIIVEKEFSGEKIKYLDFLRFFVRDSAENGELKEFLDSENEKAFFYAILFVDKFSHKFFEVAGLTALPYKWIEYIEKADRNSLDSGLIGVLRDILFQYYKLNALIVNLAIKYLFHRISIFEDVYQGKKQDIFNGNAYGDLQGFESKFIDDILAISKNLYKGTNDAINITREYDFLQCDHHLLIDLNVAMEHRIFDFRAETFERHGSLKNMIETVLNDDNPSILEYIECIISKNTSVTVIPEIDYVHDPRYILNMVGYVHDIKYICFDPDYEASKKSKTRKTTKKKNQKFEDNIFNTDH